MLLLISHPVFAYDFQKDKEFSNWIRTSLKKNHIPGLVIVVIENGRVKWAQGFGVKNIKTKEPITSTTLFQAGSISKPVTAMAALHAVQNGKIILDENINHFLISWKVPENKFTTKKKVTLRRLLNHSAGISVHGFIGYAAGEKIPTLIEVLNGTPPANSERIQVIDVPGKKYSYSGCGYTIIQLALMDIYKQPFNTLMTNLVLEPLGMYQSTFAQPLPSSLMSQIALPYNQDMEEFKGGPHTYVAQAAAGLWTTPLDLAKFIIAVQNALHGKSGSVLKSNYARLLVAPSINKMTSLGFMLVGISHDKIVEGGHYFMHNGEDEGYRSIIFGDAIHNNGIVIMTNMSADYRLVMEKKIKYPKWTFISSVLTKIISKEKWN